MPAWTLVSAWRRSRWRRGSQGAGQPWHISSGTFRRRGTGILVPSQVPLVAQVPLAGEVQAYPLRYLQPGRNSHTLLGTFSRRGTVQAFSWGGTCIPSHVPSAREEQAYPLRYLQPGRNRHTLSGTFSRRGTGIPSQVP